MPSRYRQFIKAARLKGNQHFIWVGLDLPKRRLDENFPDTGRAEKNSVRRIGNKAPGAPREFGTAREPPEEQMRWPRLPA